MQLQDISPSIEDMTDEELRLRLVELRKRREKVPTKKIHKEKMVKTKESRKTLSSLEGILEGLSEADIVSLITQLKGDAA